MMHPALVSDEEITHFHLFCGLGGGARGFNRGTARVGNLRAKFRCLGGVDNDPAAIRDFNRRVGVPGTVLDLFDREQYRAYYGEEPPPEWSEATPDDILRAANYEFPDIVFLSAPCKGFSGLLSESRSQGPKYQALNRLTLRGMWLMLEAFKDKLPALVLFENVPRIVKRGEALLRQIRELLIAYGYAVSPIDERSFHDCGELGGLGQSRKRFLMVARHIEKVPPFLYEPPRRPLRSVGEILDKMPRPGDPIGGAMHGIPNLHWRTWVRLAFVEAGSDWRSLNRLEVEDGFLKDYLIVPEYREGTGFLGVNRWDESSGAVAGRSGPTNGNYSVADPRMPTHGSANRKHGLYRVEDWTGSAHTIHGSNHVSGGAISIADPRFQGQSFGQFGVCKWEEATGTITSQRSPGQGRFSVADPTPGPGKDWHHNIYRIVRWNQTRGTVTGGDGPSNGGQAVADPRPQAKNPFGKFAIARWDGSTGTVIGGDDSGAYGVADPKCGHAFTSKKYKVTHFNEPANSVIAASTTGQGAFAVADPNCGLDREKGDNYLTAGQYGVVPWDSPSGVISGSARHDNGRFNVADPNMPKATDKLVCLIRSLDNCWHRPFTTLELAALQSLVDPDEMFDLDGRSDSAKRERIGNAVPPDSAQAIASVMGQTLLMARAGVSFQLSEQSIWVRPYAVALSVDTSKSF